MKVVYSIIVAALLAYSTISCTTMKYQMINADMSLVSLGMDKEQVYQQIGRPNNIISAQQLPEGDMEVLEYLRSELNSYTEKYSQRPIWLYFLDNKLIEWGPGEDWQGDQAMKERAIERYRNRQK